MTRPALVARWLELTRTVLPSMAAAQGWPIKRDHCFMRALLDQVLGAPWHAHVARPAIRHLDLVRLAEAVALAERVVREPAILPALNRASLLGRRAARQRQPTAAVPPPRVP